ncbi:TrmB family transcriptional regulator [Haladaptatus sp. F3-133]|uniref:TrmB family transcriptional regulator n=1 Tax=Halorutilus salinus TaxID=2487751 RepID=A0A9Q4GG67_9EURY|nr:helix-turn-helix domain-containing protein [Halorutilus salinus]MCX2818377.1 TrmB family transcriptional regulator [Halorutilus salinus]
MPDEFAVYECRSCDNYVLSTAADSEMTCCGGSIERVDQQGASIQSPETKPLFKQAFGTTETEMEICLCVMDEGEATANDISDVLGVERSVVSRYANHLVEVGFLHKSERNLREGGRVHVYTHATGEEVTRSLTLGFYRWAAEATRLIDEFGRKKMEHMAESEGSEKGGEEEGEDGVGVYWE